PKSAIKRDETFSKVYSFSGNEKCDTSIWEERHLKLLGLDIYGSLNGKEVSQSATRSGENRRRDDDEAAPEEEAEGDDEGNKDDFDWEAGKKSRDVNTKQDQATSASSSAQQKDQEPAGVDPSGLTGREADFLKFQAEFERKRANRFHDELEKAKAENAKLLALLHKTQTKLHP
ncbi:hypothetical protein Dimus_020478, partial [Dionaea muscipula]